MIDLKKFNELKKERVDIHKLYIWDCLNNSLNKEITDEEMIDLINEVDYLWLEDENNTCISRITDFVVAYKDKLKDMDKWEKLNELADFGCYDYEDEEEN